MKLLLKRSRLERSVYLNEIKEPGAKNILRKLIKRANIPRYNRNERISKLTAGKPTNIYRYRLTISCIESLKTHVQQRHSRSLH